MREDLIKRFSDIDEAASKLVESKNEIDLKIKQANFIDRAKMAAIIATDSDIQKKIKSIKEKILTLKF